MSNDNYGGPGMLQALRDLATDLWRLPRWIWRVLESFGLFLKVLVIEVVPVLLTVAVVLGVLYGLVRFVKWAWVG